MNEDIREIENVEEGAKDVVEEVKEAFEEMPEGGSLNDPIPGAGVSKSISPEAEEELLRSTYPDLDPEKDNEETEKKDKPYGKLLIVCAIVAIVGFIACFMVHKNLKPVEEGATEAVEIATVENPGLKIDTNTDDIGATVKDPFEGRMITYQGLSDMEFGPGTRFQLQNPNREEDVYMEFTLTEGGEEVFKSDFVPAGRAKEIIFYDLLPEGEHEISVLMQPYIRVGDRFLACTVNNVQRITVTVK